MTLGNMKDSKQDERVRIFESFELQLNEQHFPFLKINFPGSTLPLCALKLSKAIEIKEAIGQSYTHRPCFM